MSWRGLTREGERRGWPGTELSAVNGSSSLSEK